MKVAIIGLGYVGFAFVAPIRPFGRDVFWGLDIDPAKVDVAQRGKQLHQAHFRRGDRRSGQSRHFCRLRGF